MAGTCGGTINVTLYREASIASCQFPTSVIIGQPSPITLIINQGTVTENYKLVFSGDLTGESAPFTISAGAGLQEIIKNVTFTTSGDKIVTVSLVKV